MFRARRAHHRERQIVSIQPLVTEKNLCITLVIYQESLHDARSTECKTSLNSNETKYLNKRHFKAFVVHSVLLHHYTDQPLE